MQYKNILFSCWLLNHLSKGVLLIIGMGTSLALWAQNATFDFETGTLHIPRVEVPQVLGNGIDCYQVDLGLVPGTTIMTFTLLNAVPLVSPEPLITPCPPVISYNEEQSRRLAGTWTFSYRILNDFKTSSYNLDLVTVEELTTKPGKYAIWGTDEYGELVIAGYNPEYDDFSLLDSSGDIDNWFFFSFTSEDTVSGCYFQKSNTVENSEFSECYKMTGIRTARTNYRIKSSENSSEEQDTVGKHRASQATKRKISWIRLKNRYEETYKQDRLLREEISKQVGKQ
jgi:hypothetical protein